jgi:hypothetical protein
VKECVLEKIKYINSTKPEIELPAYHGQTDEIMAPDTLDLQDMAGIGVNGLTGPTDPEADYEIYWKVSFNANKKPIMWHSDPADMTILAKFAESLPLLRLISGSDQDQHIEQRWLEVLRQMQGPNGLLYAPKIGRPWCVWDFKKYAPWCNGEDSQGDHYVCPFLSGRALGVMTLYHLLTEDPQWKNAGRKLVDGFENLAVVDGKKAHLPVTDAQNPGTDRPSALSHKSCIQGLANYARCAKYEPALDLAGKLALWVMEDFDYYGPDGQFLEEYPGASHVHFHGRSGVHFHGHTGLLVALLDYGTISGDQEAVDFAHRGFRYGMTQGDTILGCFPEWLDVAFATSLEICELADMIALAVKLSRNGTGDYWDMADRWVRNLFVEGQLKRVDRLNWLSERMPETEFPTEIPPHHCTDRVAERNIGAFVSTLGVNDQLPGGTIYMGSYLNGIGHCCTANATRTIYYVWENMITHEAGKLRVNLCLNRGSRWADVNSHIPYKGQVDVKVKEPVELSVRIPEWVQPGETKCTVNSGDCNLKFDGRYAVVGKVVPGDLVSLVFPITESCDRINVEKRSYRVLLKGNTCVDVDPPGVNVPLFRRDHYRESETRWRNRTRFIADQQIEW